MLISANAVMTITIVSRRKPQRLERIRDAGDHRPDGHQHEARHHGLDRPGQVEAGDQLEARDRRHEVALVQAARLVVDEDDAAADHHHHEDRHDDRARQQILDVRHVRIDLDDVEVGVGRDARRRDRRRVVGADEAADDAGHRRRDEGVGVVFDERDSRVVLREHAPREVRRDGQHAVQLAVAQVPQRGSLVAVVDGVEGPRARRDRLAHLLDVHGGDAVVGRHDPELQVLDVAAEGVAEHDQLHEREDHRDDDERRAAAEAPHLTFDDGEGSLHGDLAMECRMDMKKSSAASVYVRHG